jgi:RNA polymerase sigma factor (TIGR02999 family)
VTSPVISHKHQIQATKSNNVTSPSSSNLTHLLTAWSEGDQSALETLTPLVHEELRRLARHYMNGERPGHTLQTTALVNEAYLRLIDQKRVEFKNRTQFFALAATLMRHILVDHARRRHYLKRGGGAQRVSLDKVLMVCGDGSEDLVALDAALDRLAAIDTRKSKVVELRFFGGLSVEETAEALAVSAITVMREWRMAKAWLYNSLNEP